MKGEDEESRWRGGGKGGVEVVFACYFSKFAHGAGSKGSGWVNNGARRFSQLRGNTAGSAGPYVLWICGWEYWEGRAVLLGSYYEMFNDQSTESFAITRFWESYLICLGMTSGLAIGGVSVAQKASSLLFTTVSESTYNDQTRPVTARPIAHISCPFSLDITTPFPFSITTSSATVFCIRKAIPATIRTKMAFGGDRRGGEDKSRSRIGVYKGRGCRSTNTSRRSIEERA